ncbi:MAG: polysaccharide pyruvyl transferase family protein [Mastigocoleus sp.]
MIFSSLISSHRSPVTKVGLFDPGIENNIGTPSANLGDLIIQEAVEREINQIFPDIPPIKHISTHTFPRSEHIDAVGECSLFFVGGTNLLSSKMNLYRHWKFSLSQQMKLSKSVLLGVGWAQYEEKPNFQTSLILKCILSNKIIHSVRDSYTQMQLNSAGIKNVLNTGCPTMWPLAHLKADRIPTQKADNALVMFTDYSKQPELDRKLLEIVGSKYDKVFVWPQGRGDQEYVSNLSAEIGHPITMLKHSFDAFKEFLDSGITFDYIGTRLHGGVKCLLNGRRALVIEIDNRAKEIAKDTNLPTAERGDFHKIHQWIDNPSVTRIQLSSDAIDKWRGQFKNMTLKSQT